MRPLTRNQATPRRPSGGVLELNRTSYWPPWTPRIREFTVPADLVLVAIGFSHPEHEGLVTDLDLELDQRGNIKAGAFATSMRGVFTAGDSRIGQSLIVNAIADGRRCARIVERYLAGGGNGARAAG